MDEIYTKTVNLPTTIRGYTVRDNNGDYNIFINARISREAMLEAYRHELKHIGDEDFDKYDVQIIELDAHK